MNNMYDVKLSGKTGDGWFGISVSTAGDVNNDGCSDVVVGTYFDKAYIFYGGVVM